MGGEEVGLMASVIVCDLCKKRITGVPQGNGTGNPAKPRFIRFSEDLDDREVPYMDYEVCWTCSDKIKVKAESLRRQ